MHRYAEIITKLRSIQSRSKGELLKQAADALEQLQKEQEEERYRHDRLQDFDVAEAEQLRQMTVERNMLARKLREVEEPCQKKEVRLIDANALDTLLEDVEKGYKKNFLFKSAKELRWIRDAISALRTIDPESLRSQWRNAETAPPQEPGEYIVMIKGGANATTLLYDGGLWFEEDEEGWQTYYDVTHWLPLPEPPAKES